MGKKRNIIDDRQEAVARFEAKFIPEPMSGCWLWVGGIIDDGYGYFRLDGTDCRAHRASWLLYRGEISAGKQLCHRCDVVSCGASG